MYLLTVAGVGCYGRSEYMQPIAWGGCGLPVLRGKTGISGATIYPLAFQCYRTI